MKNADTWRNVLDQTIDKLLPELVDLRRHLHKQPELSGQEYQTTSYVARWLQERGIHVTVGPDDRGLVADVVETNHQGMDSAASEGVFALRADIDALPIQDQKEVSYASGHRGIMHACGHDAHTAMVAGALRALALLRDSGELVLTPSVRGIFQPAEETCEGALHMINAGALDRVQAICATHVDPTRQVGHIALRHGVLTANCDEIQVFVRGEGGHSSRPHQARDPIAAAAQYINSVYANVPRSTDTQEPVVVTFGSIAGGQASNVIPDEVKINGTLRTLDSKIREDTIALLSRLAESIALASRTDFSVSIGVGTGAVRNDEEIANLFVAETKSFLGPSGIQWIPRPSMGSEDFAFFTDRVPGAMFRLGCASGADTSNGLHTPRFDVDEKCLAVGCKLMARTALAWLCHHQKTQDFPEAPVN